MLITWHIFRSVMVPHISNVTTHSAHSVHGNRGSMGSWDVLIADPGQTLTNFLYLISQCLNKSSKSLKLMEDVTLQSRFMVGFILTLRIWWICISTLLGCIQAFLKRLLYSQNRWKLSVKFALDMAHVEGCQATCRSLLKKLMLLDHCALSKGFLKGSLES